MTVSLHPGPRSRLRLQSLVVVNVYWINDDFLTQETAIGIHHTGVAAFVSAILQEASSLPFVVRVPARRTGQTGHSVIFDPGLQFAVLHLAKCSRIFLFLAFVVFEVQDLSEWFEKVERASPDNGSD